MNEHNSDFTDYSLFYLLTNLSKEENMILRRVYKNYHQENIYIFFTHFKFASKINFPENKEKRKKYM